ncbi:bifunctional folylpolyglutamate synthase/dihydrofolate synthase [Gracilimonas tropica]|uniref:bifunctional folylpolyglutamate synthase/dihydrofolate synthase n=1 Tax=Gracilimonas tropica TaxID=454600 RepID=UPI0003635EBF|nr:Mur ligase family protein [Gracilimonas tropica]
MSRFKKITDVWDFLNEIPMFQKSGASASNFSLDKINAFCELLGNPQDEYPTIHVAGTNGKGTTSYLLEQVYAEAGYKTGLFTSPHLIRYNERVRVCRQEIPDSEILRFFQVSEPFFEKIKLTYFEISTALAFWYFADQKVDIAVIETGLGGRLDSTNIISSEVAVMTSIGLDHQDILGDTKEKIAREKAGIIKRNKPVVIGDITGSVRKEISEAARKMNAPLYEAKHLDPKWDQGNISLRSGKMNLNTHFKESVNKWNVAMVYLTIEILVEKFPVSHSVFKKAVELFPGAPARFERLHTELDWYFSGSHNEQALRSSVEALEEIAPKEEWTLIFSALKDKWNPQMKEYFSGYKQAYFVEQQGERAKSYREIQKEMDVLQLDEQNSKIILKELKTALVIFMGSFYFYPIAKRWTTDVS